MRLNRKEFIRLLGWGGSGLAIGRKCRTEEAAYQISGEQKFNMHGYAAPKIDTIRIGLIGIGERGSGTARRLAGIEGVDIKALCDIVPHRVENTVKLLKDEFPQYAPQAYAENADTWRKVCERSDIDLIYIATPWILHAEIAIYAMEQGKHVYTELPIAQTIEDCWRVVETSERTRKHVLMMSGSCHDRIGAVVLNMVRQGVFGDLVHGEGAYIHDRVSDNDVRWHRDPDNDQWFGYRPWRLQENVNHNGNLYPQHGLGPVAQIMDLNYGDAMDYLVSVSGDDFTMGKKMKEMAQIDEFYKPYTGLDFRGNMNTTIIRTKRGRTIMLQHDISSPRPNVRFNLISGTKATVQVSPQPARFSFGHSGWVSADEFDELMKRYEPRITKLFNEKRDHAAKVSTGRSYTRVNATDWRLIDCLRNGLPLEMDVYDAALWSVVTPLSEWSVNRNGMPAKVPDFTGGSWKTNSRGMDIDIRKGGTTNLL